MTQKFYMHPGTTTDTGTLPTTTNAGLTSVQAVTNNSVNRNMDATPGSTQTSIAYTTLANTSAQLTWIGKWVTAPLQAQTNWSNTFTVHLGASVSNSNSNFFPAVNCYLWRPSTGAVVDRLVTSAQLLTTLTTVATTETALSDIGGVPNTVTWLDGDILVLELWRASNVQGMATAYTNTVFFDGTTDDSTTSNAAFFDAGADMPLFTGSAAALPELVMAPRMGP